MYTTYDLLEPVSKADRYLESMLAGIIPTRPDGEYILPNQAFYIWWGISIFYADKVMTCIECHCEIDLIFILSLCPFENYMLSDY